MVKIKNVRKWSGALLMVLSAFAQAQGSNSTGATKGPQDIPIPDDAARSVVLPATPRYQAPVSSVFGETRNVSPSVMTEKQGTSGRKNFSDELNAIERKQEAQQEEWAKENARQRDLDPRGKWPGQVTSPGNGAAPAVINTSPANGVACASSSNQSTGCRIHW